MTNMYEDRHDPSITIGYRNDFELKSDIHFLVNLRLFTVEFVLVCF